MGLLGSLVVAVLAAAYTLSTLSIVGIPKPLQRFKWIVRTVKVGYVPQRATWFGWLLVDIVLVYSSFMSGGVHDPTFILSASYMVGALVVFALSVKHGKGGNTAFDQICILLTAAGGVTSYCFGLNGAGIALASLALWISAIPNLQCASEKPEEESLALWWLFLAAAVLSLLRVADWTKWTSWLFPVSDTIFMIVMLGVIYRAFVRHRKRLG